MSTDDRHRLREDVARLIWETSRADEGTISATGANIVADALISAGLIACAQADPATCANPECDHNRTIPSPGCALASDPTPEDGLREAIEALADEWGAVLAECKSNDRSWILDRSVATLETCLSDLNRTLAGHAIRLALAEPREQIKAEAVITIPKPQIYTGPRHLTVDEATAHYLRDAALRVRTQRYWGSGVTALVSDLLDSVADRIAQAEGDQ